MSTATPEQMHATDDSPSPAATEEQAPSVIEALTRVMGDVQYVGKGGWNDHQKFKFRGIDDVMNAVGPVLRRHKVILMPRIISHELTSRPRPNGGTTNFATVTVEYTAHGPAGDTISGSAAGEAFDTGDKATPKAMSVAFRTFLLQALCLPTDEPDPDAQSYEETRPTAEEQKRHELMTQWQQKYNEAGALGRDHFAEWLKWAEQNGGPPQMIAAGRRALASTPADAEPQTVNN